MMGTKTSIGNLKTFLRWLTAKPSTRGALKNAHQAFFFLEEVAGVSKQAPHFFTVLLAALEDMVTNEILLVYLQLYASWMCVQCWRMLRFSDHRGLRQDDCTMSGGSFTSKLTRSKTIGHDKSLNSRLVVVECFCDIHKPAWLAVTHRSMHTSP